MQIEKYKSAFIDPDQGDINRIIMAESIPEHDTSSIL